MTVAALDWRVRELDRCKPWLEAALAYQAGMWGWDQVERAVLAGKAQLWPGERSAMVTELVAYGPEQAPRAKAVHVFLGGGELAELIGPLRLQAEDFGRREGCTHHTIDGRPGWARVFAPLGYRTQSVKLVRQL